MLGWIGVAIGVLSLVLGADFFFWSRRYYRIFFQTSTLKLIGGSLPDNVSIQVDGDEKIVRLSKTTVRIWNSGTQALTKDKVANPIKIRFDADDWIIDADILSESDPSIGTTDYDDVRRLGRYRFE